MKEIIRWVLLFWTILAIPYTFVLETNAQVIAGLVYTIAISLLLISDLRGKNN